MKISISIFLILSLNPFGKCEFDNTTIKQIDLIVETEFMIPNDIPAVGFSVVKDGNMYSAGYGVKNNESNLLADKDTIFAIGSVSKSFNGIIAAKVLSEKFPEEKFVMEIPVTQLLPNSNVTFFDKYRHERITFKDMLSHRTCLDTSSNYPIFFGAYKDHEDYMYRERYADEVCSIRTQFVYNNGIHDYASYLIGLIAGKPFKQIAMEFFGQLGMSRTQFITKEWNKKANIAQGYYRSTDPEKPIKLLDPIHYDRLDVLEGAGGILSTASDMEKYINFHINKGKVGETVVVPESVLNWVYEPSMLNRGSIYGLGLAIDPRFIFHDGYLPPFACLFTFVPEYNMGMFSVINGPGPISDQENFGFMSLHEKIYNLINPNPVHENKGMKLKDYTLFKQEYLSTKGIEAKDDFKGKDIIRMEDHVGLYGNGLWGEFNILYKDNNLTLEYGDKWGHGDLVPRQAEKNNTFWIEWTTDMTSFLEALSGGTPVARYFLEFEDPDTVWFDSVVKFKRGATRDTFPEFPWKEVETPPEKDSANSLISSLLSITVVSLTWVL